MLCTQLAKGREYTNHGTGPGTLTPVNTAFAQHSQGTVKRKATGRTKTTPKACFESS